MKINDVEICDETMHMVVVEGEALTLLTSKTGSWRSVRPILSQRVPPCTGACPAGMRIRDYLALMEQGDYDQAWNTIQQENPFPAITGRVCPCFCEPACNRAQLDEPVAIKKIERLLGDYGLEKGYRNPETAAEGKRVAVVGAGPAGLSGAYYLRQLGHRVTLFEASEEPGGMLIWGVPEFRLPKAIVRKQIDALRGLDIEIRTGVAIGKDVSLDDLKAQGFEALLIAVGAQKDLNLNIPGIDARGVFAGVGYLHEINSGRDVNLGERVVVIGGGNTAIDAARVALKNGAGRVEIVYRRSREEMPAIAEEVEEALAEGITIRFQTAPREILVKDGKVAGIRCVKMALKDLDESGRKRPAPIEGSEFDVAADAVITAIGQQTDLSFMGRAGAEIIAEGLLPADPETLKNEAAGFFAAGDVHTGPDTVIRAIAEGKRASMGIHNLLCGAADTLIPVMDQEPVGIDDINLNYFPSQPRNRLEGPDLEGQRDAVTAEVGRCFHCGACTVCNTCWFMCPDAAIKHHPKGVEIDYDYCKGCGICAHECPCGVILIEEESKWQ